MVGFRRGLACAGFVLRIGGEHNLTGAVKHANAVDALFGGDGLHHLVGGLAVIVQHGVPGSAGDAFGQLIGAQDHRVQELSFFGGYVNQAGNRRHNDHDDGDREHQLPDETTRHN